MLLERDKELRQENEAMKAFAVYARAFIRELSKEIVKVLSEQQLKQLNKIVETLKTLDRGQGIEL